MGLDPYGHCSDCGAPLAHDQRYCLSCGARVGPRSPQLLALLRRNRDPRLHQPTPPEARSAAAPHGPRPRTRRAGLGAGLTLPSPRVSAVLVLAFLGFGALLGDAAASGPNDATASRRDLKLLLGSRAPASQSSSTASPSSATSSETPASEPEATPSSEPQSGAGAAAGGSPRAPKSGTRSASQQPSGGSGQSSAQGSGTGTESSGAASKLPNIRHVFVVMLDDQPYATVFGPESSAHYLADTLEPKGALLVRYYAVAHQQLANAVALISGQGPTQQTAQNCPTYEDIAPASAGAEGQVIGNGCVYPSTTQTLVSQLSAKHLTWRAYIEGIDEGAETPAACAHPTLGAADPSAAQPPPATQRYATWRNPFVYFSALTGSPACASDDAGLSRLKPDLSSVSSTPSFAYIVPDLCNDGNPTPCAPGAPAGIGPADAFLQRIVPEIIASKAYKQNGLLVITVDEAPSSGEFADSSACCGQPLFPNLPPAASGLKRPGGGVVGALLLSPFIKSHEISQETYNHFSLLRTIEDLFGLSHLGYAGGSKVSSFEPSLFSASGH